MVGNNFMLHLRSTSVLPVYESLLRFTGPKRYSYGSTFLWTYVLDFTIWCCNL